MGKERAECELVRKIAVSRGVRQHIVKGQVRYKRGSIVVL